MLISTRYGYVFVCVPKCASTSIEAALRKHANIAVGGVPQIKHTSFAEYRAHLHPFLSEKLGAAADAFACVALFREPLDWLSSWYSFRSRPALEDPAHPQHSQFAGNVTFAHFVDEHCRAGRKGFAQFKRQYHYVASEADKIEGIQLYRYEQIDRFLKDMSDRIGQPIALETKNPSPKRELNLSEDDKARAQKYLEREYHIYESI